MNLKDIKNKNDIFLPEMEKPEAEAEDEEEPEPVPSEGSGPTSEVLLGVWAAPTKVEKDKEVQAFKKPEIDVQKFKNMFNQKKEMASLIASFPTKLSI